MSRRTLDNYQLSVVMSTRTRSKRRVLGIGGSDHDFSACLIEDGSIVVAIEDERLCRIKHGSKHWASRPTRLAMDYCLSSARVELGDIDLVVSNVDLEAIDATSLPCAVTQIPHHLAHAASAYFPSDISHANLVVIDGSGGSCPPKGSLETISIGEAEGTKVRVKTVQSGRRMQATGTWKYMTSNSIGGFYKLVTDTIGFGDRGQGKTMGLASYGDSSLVGALSEFVSIDEDELFTFDPYGGIFDWLTNTLSASRNAFQVRANLARAAQELFESAVLAVFRRAKQQAAGGTVCYAGGCALNTRANRRIEQESGFHRLFIPPACSDAGLAIGAAFLGYHTILGEIRSIPPASMVERLPFTGREYSDGEILMAVERFPVHYRYLSDVTDEAIERLLEGQVIGWFQGSSEMGPRALGHRSILADPSSSRMRDHINLHVKHRESFRPLAPIVPVEEAQAYFELDAPAPFMLTVARVRDEFRRRLAAVCHVDQTARLQTITEHSDPLLYQLLRKYGHATGVPVLLNTSFNRRGEPIVESPTDALHCFIHTPIDALFLGSYLVTKYTPWAQPESILPLRSKVRIDE